jgi:type IX secretion system PorP/SprF family membrane protein
MNKLYTKSKFLKILSIIVLVSFGKTEVFSQNQPMYSQYMFNMTAVNPAYAGSRGAINLNYFGRAQWSGIDGSPTTNAISIDGSSFNGRLGLGAQLYNDKIGVYSNNIANLMFSTRLKVSDNGVLSGGIQLGLMNSKASYINVQDLYDPNDNVFQQNLNKWSSILGAGLFFNNEKFYIGLSVPNLLNKVDINSQNPRNDAHVFLASGYVFDINEDLKFKPSTLIKMSSYAPVELDINANFWYKNMIGLGVALRTGDAYVGMVEVQVMKQLRIGYAYDYTISALRTIAGSTNEIMFRYELGRESKNVKSTRYF